MNPDHSTHLQGLLDRLQRGDDAARSELIGCAYERLRLLARKLLHQDFPRFDRLHDTGSVLDETVLRLLDALREVQPATVRDFFTFAATQTRRVLLDMARKHRRNKEVPVARPAGGDRGQGGWQPDAPDQGESPSEMEMWSEFHRLVEQLRPDERAVVDLHWYQGLTQAETARILGVSPKAVSRCWIKARLKLARWMPNGVIDGRD